MHKPSWLHRISVTTACKIVPWRGRGRERGLLKDFLGLRYSELIGARDDGNASMHDELIASPSFEILIFFTPPASLHYSK